LIDFHKNKMIDQVLNNYYGTFSKTLDTADYVPEKFNKKISKYIYKNMKKKFKEIDREYKKYFSLMKRKKSNLAGQSSQKLKK